MKQQFLTIRQKRIILFLEQTCTNHLPYRLHYSSLCCIILY